MKPTATQLKWGLSAPSLGG